VGVLISFHTHKKNICRAYDLLSYLLESLMLNAIAMAWSFELTRSEKMMNKLLRETPTLFFNVNQQF